ncbi:SprT-like family-domain-containing protein [Zychaea mexicana]|uniref:SprT-like family-domain-containing protein n=1 Tax=Zychaea mexicana TaxID=64656 RepID=UPI0022FE0532|nr:SprT-like family-domain-containing protein [Zychaea mexicana]KAI9488150.1 SprT-like family-domain-containing protein [Zychaea mexicana]
MSQSSSGSSTDEGDALDLLLHEKEQLRRQQQQDHDADLALARYLQEQEDLASRSPLPNICVDLEADLALAKRLQEQEEEEQRQQQKEQEKRQVQDVGSSSSSAIIIQDASPDPVHELLDPNPDLHALFLAFDHQFFKGQLASVEIKWSTRMTLCAGICEYKSGGYVVIKLSEPLLKYRPREDMVNTLLHEMIHALLFIQMRNDDHDGHGPEFLREADRINKTAGTNITVYHNFRDEVDHYRRHVWKCDGPCLEKPPFFGIVKRSMNRPPQPADVWFHEHQMTCGGTYTKIAEPEGYRDKSNKRPVSKITDFFKDWDEEVPVTATTSSNKKAKTVIDKKPRGRSNSDA